MTSLPRFPQKSTGLGDVFDADRGYLSSGDFAPEGLCLPLPTSICDTLEELGTPHTLARNLGSLYLSRASSLRELSLMQFDTAFPAERTFLLEPNSVKLKVFKGLLKATLEQRYSKELLHYQEVIIQLAGVWTSDDEQNSASVRRSSFTKSTIDTLQSLYDLNQYPNPVELKTIAVKVGLQPKQIRAWFQNRRNRRTSPARSHRKSSKITTKATAISDLKFNHGRKMCSRRATSTATERNVENVLSRLGSPISLQTDRTFNTPQSQEKPGSTQSSTGSLFDARADDREASSLWSAVASDRSSDYANFERTPQIETSLSFAIPDPANLMSTPLSDEALDVCSNASSSRLGFPSAFNSTEVMDIDPVNWTMIFGASHARDPASESHESSVQWIAKAGRGNEGEEPAANPNMTTGR